MKRFLAANPQCSVQVILRWIAIVVWSALGLCEKPAIAADVDPVTMAQSVTIHRDDWGVPHIYGTTDASIAFGMAYAQCEDYFWQLEDTYIQSLGRYAEIHGESGLNNDLLHRTFEIDRRSREDYANLKPPIKKICDAYVAGINYFLQKNPEVKPRLIERFEPWHVVAYDRFIMLSFVYGKSHAPRPNAERQERLEDAVIGSNQWAIAPEKTRDGHAMLFVNPHQPFYGPGQFYEAHVKNQEGINFSGACFFGSPFPSLGHNEYLGWAYTVNEPDIADVYRETFDLEGQPLMYRYADGYRKATQWQDSIEVKTDEGMETRQFTFLKTHHGPCVAVEDDQHRLAVKIAALFGGTRIEQGLRMIKAKNLEEWLEANRLQLLPMFNAAYADRKGNIFYLYNGTIPIREPGFDWRRPVDGSDPRTEWKGIHPLEDLPQVLNPPTGYVQNCNSTPFTTTDDGNPFEGDFPSYMVEEKHDDKRRAKISRKLLREAQQVTFEDWQRLALDTTLYWPLNELPKFRMAHQRLALDQPEFADRVRPYLEHLLAWDCRSTLDCTRTTLCVAWYGQMYGQPRPSESLAPEFVNNPKRKFEALIAAAESLEKLHGDWRVPWGKVNRMQRVPRAGGLEAAAALFRDQLPSLPCAGVEGPLGVAFNVYYTPSAPLRKQRFGVAGNSYAAVYEFSDRIKSKSLLQYGNSGDPNSPHYFDQAKLYSEEKFKDAYFYDDEVEAHTVKSYHPGEE